jgi:hypothetical protein
LFLCFQSDHEQSRQPLKIKKKREMLESRRVPRPYLSVKFLADRQPPRNPQF